MIQRLAEVYDKNGAEALLPQNLPEDVYDFLQEQADPFIADELGEEDAGFACLLFCVLMILDYQNGGNGGEVEVPVEGLHRHMERYCFTLALESITRITDQKVERATLQNIFDEDRQVEIT